jgi:4-amino-4-deoxy-L-arabinose transferase-like glycosyltransferase
LGLFTQLKGPVSRAVALVKRHPAGVALCAVFVLYFATRLYHIRSLPVFCDEGIYIRWGQLALHNGNFLVSLTDGKPPLHPLAMMPFIAVIKDPLLAGRVTSVFFGAFTTLGVFLLGKELGGKRLGVISALLYVICPLALWYDRLALAEGMLLTFFTFAIYFAVKARKSKNLWYLVGAAAASALALLTKSTALLLFPIIPFAYLVKRGEPGETKWFKPIGVWLLAVGASCLVAYGVLSLLRFAANFHFIAELEKTRTLPLTQVLHSPFTVLPGNAGALITVLFVYLTPVYFLACFAGLLLGVLEKWRGAWFLLVWFVGAGLAVSLVAMFHFTRFFLILLPPVLIGAAYGILSLMEFLVLERSKGFKASVIGLSLVTVALLFAIIIPTGIQMSHMIKIPAKASLPSWDREQFITTWPAGWGTAETAAFLDRESKKGKIVVAGVGAPGTQSATSPSDSLAAYLFGNKNVQIIPVTVDKATPMPQALAATGKPTYCVINGVDKVPKGWPVEVIARYPKDGNDKVAMFLTRVIPPANQGE